MQNDPVTVAIPVRDGGPRLGAVLEAVRAQRLERPVELLIADSGSRDGSAELARRHGATVVPVERFSHGGTRNLLMRRASGSHVVFLTQDAVPADDRWLRRLLSGFELAGDVGLVFGPYRARPDAPHWVARELRDVFAAMAPDGRPRVDRGAPGGGPGPASFFTDANGAVARRAWERVPFRDVAYAEDQQLALDMLRAGWAKAFVPDAVVEHSHHYPPVAQFRRFFDEWRGLLEVYGWREPADPRRALRMLRGQLAADWRFLRERGTPPSRLPVAMLGSLGFWTMRAVASQLGSRADRLPPALRRRFSLERRASFAPGDSLVLG